MHRYLCEILGVLVVLRPPLPRRDRLKDVLHELHARQRGVCTRAGTVDNVGLCLPRERRFSLFYIFVGHLTHKPHDVDASRGWGCDRAGPERRSTCRCDAAPSPTMSTGRLWDAKRPGASSGTPCDAQPEAGGPLISMLGSARRAAAARRSSTATRPAPAAT